MFGKPKVAKPRTAAEAAKVKAGVERRHPQMKDPNWGKPVKSGRKAALESALTPEEIKKLKGD